MGIKDWFGKKKKEEPFYNQTMKGGNNMANDEIESLDEDMTEAPLDDEDLEAQEKPAPNIKTKSRPLRASPRPTQQQAPAQKAQAPQERYVAFKREAVEGVMDTFSVQIFTTDIWAMLASIKSDIDNLSSRVGD